VQPEVEAERVRIGEAETEGRMEARRWRRRRRRRRRGKQGNLPRRCGARCVGWECEAVPGECMFSCVKSLTKKNSLFHTARVLYRWQ
jgi:hypothetical protein